MITTNTAQLKGSDPKGTKMHEYTSTTVNPESGAIMFNCSCGDCFSKSDMALHLRIYTKSVLREFIRAYKKAGL